MTKIIVLWLLLICSVCYGVGGDRYVDPDVADDLGTGLDRANAMQKIDTAYVDIETGNTIWLMESTAGFTDASQGTDWHIDIDRAAIAVTFAPDPQNATAITLDLNQADVSATDNGIEINVDTVAIEFQDLIFDCVGVQEYGIYKVANKSASVTFTDCTIHNTGSDTTSLVFANTGTASGSLIFDNCDMDSDNFTFFIIGLNLLKITDGCNIQSEDDDILRANAAMTLNTLIVEDSTLVQTDTGTSTIINYVSGVILRIRIENNTITSSNRGVRLRGVDVEEIAILDNTFIGSGANAVIPLQVGWENTDLTTWAGGQNISVGDLRYYTGEVYLNHQAINPTGAGDEPGVGADWQQFWVLATMGQIVISGNHVSYTTADLSHCLFVGYGADNSEISGNFAYNGDYQLVLKAKGCIVRNNIFVGTRPLHVFAGFGNRIVNNTLYSTSGIALFLDDQAGTHTKQDVVLNNICDASGGGTYAMTITDATLLPTHQVDYNCYVAGSSGVLDLAGTNGTDADTLAEIQAIWQGLDTAWGINDENSLIVDPRFVNAGGITPADYRLQVSSSCLNTGIRSVANSIGRSSFGAWQPYGLPVQGRRSRYAGSPLYR